MFQAMYLQEVKYVMIPRRYFYPILYSPVRTPVLLHLLNYFSMAFFALKNLHMFFVFFLILYDFFFKSQNLSLAGTFNNHLQIHLLFFIPNTLKYIFHRLPEPSTVSGARSVPTEIKYNIQLPFLVFTIPRSQTRTVFAGIESSRVFCFLFPRFRLVVRVGLFLPL